jgi:hypothetical protein
MLRYLLLALLTLTGGLAFSDTNQDFQQWSLFFLNHDFDERWAASMQVENRTAQDMSRQDLLILKPGGYYRFSDELNFGVGVKYQKKDEAPNERGLWQEIFYTPKCCGKFDWTHQVRLEERFVGGVNGVVPRLRYLAHVTHPIGDKGRYLVAQNATRFNLTSRSKGPPDGFEQNRLYFGMGFKPLPTMRFEIGYLWRFQRERDSNDRSDHVLRLQFLFDTKRQPPSHGGN